MKSIWFLLPLLNLLSACVTQGPSAQSIQTAIAQTQAALPSGVSTPLQTVVEKPTNTTGPTETAVIVKPTATKAPTNTPKPTSTPLPTSTPTVAPQPVIITGKGDSIVDTNNPFDIAIVHITGNSASHHFSVVNYDANGEYLDLLVNTTEPYDGIRTLDFESTGPTTRFEIKAVGEWKIEILPLSSAHQMNIPGSINGKDDDVILLTGAKPDIATVSGNKTSRHFAVISYDAGGEYLDLLVNTTDPYEGKGILTSDAAILDVKAVGDWTIDITSK